MTSCVIRKMNEVYSVYIEKGDIYSRRLYSGEWSEARTIACSVMGGFSVVREPFGAPAVIYRNKRGGLMLAGVGMRERCISDSVGDMYKSVYLEMIKNSEGVRIIYNRGYTDSCFIAEQHRGADITWSYPCIIDSHEGGSMTRLINLGGNCILFYTKNVPEHQLGYREIGGGIGSFKMVYATGYRIKDYSVALTQDELNVCAVISTGRINRLIYIRKDAHGISKPIIIGEGIINGCQISLCRSKPTVVFSTPKGNNILTSYDNGYSFKRVSKSEVFPFDKIPLIDYMAQYSDGFSATELVTCSHLPYDIKYCPFIKELSSI